MLVMLSVVVFMSLVYQGLSVVSYGTDFITTFPENIAYYHTNDSMTTLKITAFHNHTVVKVTVNYTLVYGTTLDSGQIQNVHFPISFKQYNFKHFLHCVRVVGTSRIVVLWITKRADSIQTNVVQPIKNLGYFYSIPALNYSKDYSKVTGLRNIPYPFAPISINRTNNTFRLIIINAENVTNYVSVSIISGFSPNHSVSLNPYEVYQVYTNSSVSVSSVRKVAVLLTHPCMETPGCGCNMVVSQVLTSNLWGDKFVIPALSITNAIWLHVSSLSTVYFKEQNLRSLNDFWSQLIPFPYLDEESPSINADSPTPLWIVSPGSVIEIIPITMFAACYLVLFNSTEGEIVVIAEKGHEGGVHIDHDPLESPHWKVGHNSGYSSVSMSLNGTHVIWHPTLKIGVYMFERMNGGILYGGTAIPLSEEPDPHGCLDKPAKFIPGTHPMTWPESHQYCLNETYQLLTPNSTDAQTQMVDWLFKHNYSDDVWIGLRRSLLTLDWYWQAGHESIHDVSYTEWAYEHPGDPWKAMCASGNLDSNKNFFWKSVACCMKMIPVCYKESTYFKDLASETLDAFVSEILS
ncbi:uncharacterized protein LOC130558586 [Triplophysa rosa]|uniref:IgGFc-binding protein n=1 Tax=Triplophysa rosa TaxID=992332 RepID=A0A9W7WRF7_TRIRA|nr:uncharacterized protein LOC130558586 [Triplophysa rosa]KAI7806978.1 putative IgGFc-binding protein [Triplophysa rosa]